MSLLGFFVWGPSKQIPMLLPYSSLLHKKTTAKKHLRPMKRSGMIVAFCSQSFRKSFQGGEEPVKGNFLLLATMLVVEEVAEVLTVVPDRFHNHLHALEGASVPQALNSRNDSSR